MRVRYTQHARRRLVALHRFIALESPDAAEAMLRGLVDHADSLSSFPRRGRIVPEYRQADIRELLRPPYRIIYRVDPAEVIVLSVMHGRQLLPDELGSEE